MLHGSSRYFLLTFYSPFCRGVALIYMKLCGAESFQSGRIWRYIGIYGDTLLPASPSIPNFIVFSISLKSLDFQGFPESGVFGLRHFRMDLYARKPCLIQIAAQPDPRIRM